jgi:hypothetical protein
VADFLVYGDVVKPNDKQLPMSPLGGIKPPELIELEVY